MTAAPIQSEDSLVVARAGRKHRAQETLLLMLHRVRTLGLRLRRSSGPLPDALVDHLSAASVALNASLRILRRGGARRPRRRLKALAVTPLGG